jgi:hypothetical protein
MSDSGERWPELQASSVTVPKHVVFRDLAQETVLLNIRTGQYHGIDHIGARFFDAMRSSSRLADACPPLAEEFGQPLEVIQRDLAAFADQMAEFGLIELS